MKYKVILHKEAIQELNSLEKSAQKKLKKDYEIINSYGIEFVTTKHIEGETFEVITDRYRSLFAYKANQIIIIAVVFTKKTQKTPEKQKGLAERRLSEYE